MARTFLYGHGPSWLNVIIVLVIHLSNIWAQPTTATLMLSYTLPGARYGETKASDLCWVNENTLLGSMKRGELLWKLTVNASTLSVTYNVLDCVSQMVGVACWNNTFYATSMTLDHVRVFDFTAGGVEAMSLWYPPGIAYPNNIAVNQDKKIVADLSAAPLREYDGSRDFQTTHSIDGTTWSHVTDSEQTTYMNLTPDGYLLIVRQSMHAMWIYNTNTGTAVKVGGAGWGSGPGEFDEPMGITITPDDYVSVVDMYNQRVCTYGKDGTYHNTLNIVGDSLNFPTAISTVIQGDKTIMALETESKVKFYELT